MTEKRDERGYRVIWLVRRLFRALGRESDRHLQPFGITAAERAVLEFLDRGGPLTVPAIARRHDVTRQHIQVNVNSLLDKGLVKAVANPAHKRSPLLRLSAEGRRTFRAIRGQEARVVAELFDSVPATGLEATVSTLESVLARLKQGETP